MPTYAYACTTCDHRFEAQQSFTDDALTECPECAGRLRKLFNSVGIVFKGSGFYRTDSRSDSRTGSAASTNGSGGSKDGKNGDSAGSSDSKSSGSATKSGDTKAAASSGSTSSGSTSSGSAA